jgi:cytochrome c-type biogenesis protein CcmF
LLAWRSTSFRSVRRNFILPAIAGLVTAVVVIFCGVHPWEIFTTSDQGSFYAWMAFSMCAFVVTAVGSEFLRGAHVIQQHTGQNLFASAIQLIRRNTRRYGGYIVHFGVVVIFIGLAGGAFNQTVEQELGFKQSFKLGPYTVQCLDYSQDSNPNYDTEFAILDVTRNGKKVTRLSPEQRFYTASQQTSTIVANHSTPAWDLYIIYAGKNPDTGQPIIKAFLNPLVMWIWIGVVIIVLGTGVALVPNMSAALAAARNRPPPVKEDELVAAGRGGD